MKNWKNLSLLVLLTALTTGCDFVEELEEKSARINRFESVALNLAKENRNLKSQISQLKYDIQRLKSEKNYLTIQLNKTKEGKADHKPKASREIASVPTGNIKNDLVNYNVYKWSPSQVLAMAEKEFEQKNFEKSAQFFHTFKTQFKDHKRIDDQFLFQAGVAAYESGNHPEWVLETLGKLVKVYPTSKYYRGAKLWMALTHLQLGDEQKFFTTVEEFRKKYRNTAEWKVLSQHYEKIVQKYKN